MSNRVTGTAPSSIPPLRVGIVSGNWGMRGHLPGWRMLPQVEVTAVCTAHQETADAAAAEHGIQKAYGSFDALLNDPDIDVFSLGTRPPLRYDMTMRALQRGKHVFSCVPFAVGLPEAEAMATLQRRKGVVGAIDAYFQWTPAYSFFKELLEQGELGELFAVTANFHMGHFVRPPADYPYKWTAIASNGTGVVRNSGAQALHLLTALFGQIDEVVAMVDMKLKEWRFSDGSVLRPQVPDTAAILLRFCSGITCTLNVGRAVPSGPGLEIHAYGSKGRLTANSPFYYPSDRNTSLTFGNAAPLMSPQERQLEIPARFFGLSGAGQHPDSPYSVALSMGRLFADMVRAIETGGDATPSFAEALHVQQVVEAIHRSADQRCWVRVQSLSAELGER